MPATLQRQKSTSPEVFTTRICSRLSNRSGKRAWKNVTVRSLRNLLECFTFILLSNLMYEAELCWYNPPFVDGYIWKTAWLLWYLGPGGYWSFLIAVHDSAIYAWKLVSFPSGSQSSLAQGERAEGVGRCANGPLFPICLASMNRKMIGTYERMSLFLLILLGKLWSLDAWCLQSI